MPERDSNLISTLGRLLERTSDHHTMTLAAGLAFFGLISVAPAVGVGFGLVRLLVSPEAADALADLLSDGFQETLGLAQLIKDMENRAGRYAGIGLAVLVWPATTLASGWTRALDAIRGTDSTGGIRGLRGRVRGLIPGALLISALFLLLGAAAVGAALVGGQQLVVIVALVLGAILLQLLFCLAIYRLLPSDPPPLRRTWPGAVWATTGVVVATAAFGAALSVGEGLAQQYPPSLLTALVLGLWLYAANVALLLGAEWNELRIPAHQDDGDREDS